MPPESGSYEMLSEAQRHKVDAMLLVLFHHNKNISHPFMKELYRLKRAEFSKAVAAL